MSDVQYDVVRFRRKLLDFDHQYGNTYPAYNQQTIPRYYSSFFGSWRPEFTELVQHPKVHDVLRAHKPRDSTLLYTIIVLFLIFLFFKYK